MKFFNIKNPAAFLDKVLACGGNVYCRDSNGELRDLKHTASLLKGFSCFRMEMMDEIDVVAEQPADSEKLYRYMMEAR